MKAICKTILFLGVAVILLAFPSVALEDDNPLTPPDVALVAGPAAISISVRGTVQARAKLRGAGVVGQYPVSFRHVAGRVSNFVFRDCGSNLRSLCLLRC